MMLIFLNKNPLEMELSFGLVAFELTFFEWFWIGGPIRYLLAVLAAYGIPAAYMTFLIPERTAVEREFLWRVARSEVRQMYLGGVFIPHLILGVIKLVYWSFGVVAPPPYWIVTFYYAVNAFYYPGFIKVGLDLANDHQRDQIRMGVIKKTVLSSLLVGCLYLAVFNYGLYAMPLLDLDGTFVSVEPSVMLESVPNGFFHRGNWTRDRMVMGNVSRVGIEMASEATGEWGLLDWSVVHDLFFFHFRKLAVMWRFFVYLVSMVVMLGFDDFL